MLQPLKPSSNRIHGAFMVHQAWARWERACNSQNRSYGNFEGTTGCAFSRGSRWSNQIRIWTSYANARGFIVLHSWLGVSPHCSGICRYQAADPGLAVLPGTEITRSAFQQVSDRGIWRSGAHAVCHAVMHSVVLHSGRTARARLWGRIRRTKCRRAHRPRNSSDRDVIGAPDRAWPWAVAPS